MNYIQFEVVERFVAFGKSLAHPVHGVAALNQELREHGRNGSVKMIRAIDMMNGEYGGPEINIAKLALRIRVSDISGERTTVWITQIDADGKKHFDFS